jgi:cytidyltransferase-like protein
MDLEHKVLAFVDAPAVLRKLQGNGKKLVQCHGTFDLLHPGHIVHFEESRALGDVLVVTVTGEEHVNKGPGRPFFSDALRIKSLAALECVDFVIAVPFPAAVEAIMCVHPDIYCKGKEYEDVNRDVTGDMRDDVAAVERIGGRVVYVGSVVLSSTRLLNQNFETYAPEVRECCANLAKTFTSDDFKEIVESFSDLNVLIIGDIIFDRYSTVSVQGLTSKNRILSGRYIQDDLQAGGALAVFRHVRQFTPNVTLVSITGEEDWINETLSLYVSSESDAVLRVPEFTTVVKQRYVEPQASGKELSKLFSVNFIDAQHPSVKIQDQVCECISSRLENCDLVMAMDFGHGVLEERVRALVQEKAPFLALNCQTNSNNHGFNIINRQYERADSFSLDQTEIELATGRRNLDYSAALSDLMSALNARYAWLTRGSVETIGLDSTGSESRCPPFEDNIVDSVGAGDAFCAVTSLAAAKRLPLHVSTFMGQLAGAQAVKIVGNRDSIEKSKFLKGGTTMLSV